MPSVNRSGNNNNNKNKNRNHDDVENKKKNKKNQNNSLCSPQDCSFSLKDQLLPEMKPLASTFSMNLRTDFIIIQKMRSTSPLRGPTLGKKR